MKKPRPGYFYGPVAAITVLVAVFQLWYRPWQRTWGATEEEASQYLPGDELVTESVWQATRALSIRAEPSQVWPWLLQIGYRRAGFYSWDKLDNAGVPSTWEILPGLQGLSEGDSLPLNEVIDATVRLMDNERALLLSFNMNTDHPATWVWVLRPDGAGGTRLINRLRVCAPKRWTCLVLDAAELVMMRKHLLGLKARVESTDARM